MSVSAWFTELGAFQYGAFQDAVDASPDCAPLVSKHNAPQVSPQEWRCGCVTACYVTDRDFLRGECPFEMRLARACSTPDCETLPLIRQANCECPCHRKGDPGDGYSWIWDDDRGIRHEDWISCDCGCPKRNAGASS